MMAKANNTNNAATELNSLRQRLFNVDIVLRRLSKEGFYHEDDADTIGSLLAAKALDELFEAFGSLDSLEAGNA